MQAAFFFHRYARKMIHERLGEQATAHLVGQAFFIVNFDRDHAAAGRIFFEDIAVKVLLFEFDDSSLGPIEHLFGQIDVGSRNDQTRGIR